MRLEAEALVYSGCCVDVICIAEKNQPSDSVVDGVNVHRLPLARKRGSVVRYLFEYAAFFVLTSFVLALRLRKHYSVIHVNNMPDFLVFAALFPKIFGSRIVLDVHDPMPELFRSKYALGERSFVVRALRWQLKWSMRFSDAVLTVSDEMRKLLESIVPGKDISVVMNMPDASFTESALLPEVDRFETKPRFQMLYTGTISERYGLQIVMEAMPDLFRRIPGISLCVVGSGDQAGDLQELARNLGVSNCVEFRGYVPWTQIPGLIRQSDIGVSVPLKDVLTDLCFMGKVIEYVTAGLPTIVSRTTTMENYYTDDVVRFVDPGDVKSFTQAVIELHQRPELRLAMSRAGIAFRDRWNWSVERTKYVQLISGLCRQDKERNK